VIRTERGELAARFVALDAERVLAPGLVRWDAKGRIVSLRRLRAGETRRVEDVAVLPGLVNAHAHLQLGALPRTERRFLPWVREVMAARSACTERDLRDQAVRHLRELLHGGVTAVGEVDSTGLTPAALRRVPLAGRLYRELTGFHLRGRDATAHARSLWPDDAGPMAPGLSPHAPYSVSADLFRAAARRSRHLAIHCAELPEEQQFLRDGDGPFAELLAALGRLPDDFRPPGCGAVRHLERLGLLRPTTQLVHCQELERGDVARIAASGASIAVCPGTIRWFGRTPPDVPGWLRRGVPVALGTDSRASNTAMTLRRELRLAAELWPTLSPSQLLRMATEHGGRAVGVACGALRRGRRADLVAVDAAGDWQATLAAFVHDEARVRRVVLGGASQRIPRER
jgi:cytosine/adenosine deaminase-related metal-dependent hydrolase